LNGLHKTRYSTEASGIDVGLRAIGKPLRDFLSDRKAGLTGKGKECTVNKTGRKTTDVLEQKEKNKKNTDREEFDPGSG
jgi:hypothetical protein